MIQSLFITQVIINVVLNLSQYKENMSMVGKLNE